MADPPRRLIDEPILPTNFDQQLSPMAPRARPQSAPLDPMLAILQQLADLQAQTQVPMTQRPEMPSTRLRPDSPGTFGRSGGSSGAGAALMALLQKILPFLKPQQGTG